MLAGTPLYFFVYECLGLTLFLFWSLRTQARADAALRNAVLAPRLDGPVEAVVAAEPIS
jgi:hypothetical protein